MGCGGVGWGMCLPAIMATEGSPSYMPRLHFINLGNMRQTLGMKNKKKEYKTPRKTTLMSFLYIKKIKMSLY